MADDKFGPFTMGEVRECFNTFDLDKNSFVGAQEMRHVYRSIGEEVTDAEIEEMMNMVDQDGDGQITFGEFSKMIFRYAEQVPDSDDDDEKDGEKKVAPLSAAEAAEKQQMLRDALKNLSFQPADVADIMKKFQSSDAGMKGEPMNYEAFCSFLKVTQGTHVKKLFGLFDADGSGAIEPKEFLVGISQYGDGTVSERVRFAFELFDEDGDNQLSMFELKQILKSNYMAGNVEEVKKKAEAIMRQADNDGDGSISYDEFVRVCELFPNLMYPSFNDKKKKETKAK